VQVGSLEERFRARVAEAGTHDEARRWEACATCWEEAAEIASEARARPQLAAALTAAGEAWRRADRVVDAARVLAAGLRLDPASAGARARLAGVLGDAGRAREALAVLGDLADPVSVDTRIGLLWQVGRKEQVRPLVDALGEQLAGAFRRGQLLRMDGALDEAERCWAAVVEALADRPGAEAGVAAARTELAEIEVLRGRPALAVPVYEEGRALHEAAGRVALALRSEAGRARAATEAGIAVLPTELERGIAYARERGLAPLEVDLRIALGTASSDPGRARTELRTAEALAEALGQRLQRGRARLALATRDRDPALAALAAEDLEDHVPLRARALALQS
jgi:thioredoxin-like negative regulator of GroEL